MAVSHTYSFATSVFTLTDQFDEGEVLACGGKTYTVRATVGTADGGIDMGTNAEGTLKNIFAAINLDRTGGETGVADADFASLMVVNPDVIATAQDATTLTIKSKTPGTVGNSLPTTQTHDEGSWTSTVMANGVGDLESWVTSLLLLSQINAEVIQDLRTITPLAD